MGNQLPRRSLLYSASAAAAAGLAGCLSDGGDTDAATADANESTASVAGSGSASQPDGEEVAEDDDGGDDDLPGADDEAIVYVGAGGQPVIDPRELHVRPGATVRFEWRADGYDLTPTEQPEGADWAGVSEPVEEGHVHEHDFETPGEYVAETTAVGPETASMSFSLQVVADARPYDGEHVSDVRETENGPVNWTDRSSGTVTVGPGGEFRFDPEVVVVTAGTTLTFEWDSDNHNVAVYERPAASNWYGFVGIRHDGASAEHTFAEAGVYRFVCEPHQSVGMEGTVIVLEE